MKRITRVGLLASASSLALALAPSATAQTQVATFGLNQEAPLTVNDGSGLVTALSGLVQAVDGVVNDGVTPSIDRQAGQLNIVLDPSTLVGVLGGLSSGTAGSQLSTSMRGQTVNGATVVFPTTGTFTSGYGPRWGAFHNGIDVANAVGTPIVAVMDGTVINSGPAQGFGNWIRIRHDDGSVSVYGHMRADQLLVNVGERVSAGQQIAAIGSEGQSTGPHLHFEIHPDGTTPVDPQAWFAEQGIVF